MATQSMRDLTVITVYSRRIMEQTEEGGEGVAYRSRDEVLHEHHDSGFVRVFSHHEVQSFLLINRVYPLLVD